MKMKILNELFFRGLLPAALVSGILIACDRRLIVRHYTEISPKVTGPVRLALLTDLHNTLYGKKQHKLIDAIQRQHPDAVLFTGDMSDGQMDMEQARLLFFLIGKQFPCYYVSGNHEFWAGNGAALKTIISSYGITVLEGENRLFQANGQTIRICGVDDPARFRQGRYWGPELMAGWKKQLSACKSSLDDVHYSVLLSHRPELTAYYTHLPSDPAKGFDLVLTGHAHGGQVRIPGFANGLFAPNQGVLPPYAGGRYKLGDTVMIVSRGLCKNVLPRIFNRPELVIINIKPEHPAPAL